ncbi:hypothetical protein [Brevirhabdus sp.]|uniref:hypothetical protein n=1 Tax=Brevirhabdus sp. TaxID=2004514 RepID=UPI004057DA2B
MNMLSTTALVTTAQERKEHAVLDTVDFIRREGLMLLELFDMVGDPDGADSVTDLLGQCSSPMPNAWDLLGELREVRMSLNEIPFREIDEWAMSGKAPFDVYGAVRWSGARVEDLCARLGG